MLVPTYTGKRYYYEYSLGLLGAGEDWVGIGKALGCWAGKATSDTIEVS